ncbi:MAG: protease modulator HflC [Firmicutes bacterium]|nr:protease modulator HflC [Bacillota bacterium]MBQ4234176.1 protease modulator HflC [Bacillota bacterium]MBQ6013386.1 protease modulator HflC [Bacillota bacterium]
MTEKKKSGKGILALVLVILAVIIVSSCFVVTMPNQYTVIRQFGRVVAIRDQAGLTFRIPFLQTEDTLPKTLLIYDLPVSDVITKDKKTMTADSFALWRIDDPQLFIQTLNGSLSNAEARIENLTYNAMKNVISSKTQAEVISGRDGQLASDITAAVVDSLSPYGIELIAVETKHLDLPDDNKAAVYQRMISERQNIAAGYTAEGESEAKKIRSATDRETQIIVSQAQAQAQALIAEGEAEYMRILSDAYSDPEKADFYSFVRSLDAAKKSLTNGSNMLILDKDSPLTEIFYGE